MSIKWHVEVASTLESTQDTLRERAAAGAPEGTVVQAFTQTNGRGRRGNEWQSPTGNLYTSLLLRPNCKPDMAGQISFIIGLALSSAIDPYMAAGHSKTLKWPNDILIDGKKCAGILLESQISTSTGLIDALYVGMGVNLLAPPEGRIGLKDIVAPGAQPPAIFRFRDEMLHHVNAYYQDWKAHGFEGLRQAWMNQAHGLDHEISARLPDRTEKGIFRGIDPAGSLILERRDGQSVAIRAGEVYFGPDHP